MFRLSREVVINPNGPRNSMDFHLRASFPYKIQTVHQKINSHSRHLKKKRERGECS